MSELVHEVDIVQCSVCHRPSCAPGATMSTADIKVGVRHRNHATAAN
jgi:hypothetical protein